MAVIVDRSWLVPIPTSLKCNLLAQAHGLWVDERWDIFPGEHQYCVEQDIAPLSTIVGQKHR